MKFLFALDDPVAETLLESILESSGHELVIVSSATELEQEFFSCRWDGFFASPQFSGLSKILGRIASPDFGERPFVVLMAVKKAGGLELPAAHLAGADALLEPPIDAGRVSMVLDRIIEKRWQVSPPRDAVEGEIQTIREALKSLPPDLLPGIKRAFSAETAVYVEGLQAAVDRDDVKSIKFACHKIAGSSLTLGARGLGELCRYLECSPGQKTPSLTRELLPRIREQFERAKRNLDQAAELVHGQD